MNRTFRQLLVPCLLTLVATTAACELISTVDRSAIGGTTGTGGAGGTATTTATTTGNMVTGTGGSGGATAGTGGSGGMMATGTGGSGGTGGISGSSSSGGGCVVPATDCPAPPTCKLAVCTAGACDTMPVAANTPAGPQTDGDCKQSVCDGAGNLTSIDDNNDHIADGELCTDDTCSAGAPVHTPVAGGTDCTAEGPAPKHLCGTQGGAAAGKCVECNGAADCVSGVCTANVCTATCTDGVKNGGETGVDCGGGCPACAVGCFDGIKDGTETDIDCGSTCAAKCMVTQGCAGNSDCASNNCGLAGCQPAGTCSNNNQGGTETDKDCGGPACLGCAIGLKCLVNSDCLSKSCNTGVSPHVCN